MADMRNAAPIPYLPFGLPNLALNPQNYWGFGLFPSSGILGTRKHDVSETASVSVLRFGGKTHTQLGP
jgi:hypothetical protein